MTAHVVVVGGGFAGIEAAIHLRKARLDVTLISARDYLYMYPVSIWVPTREVEFEDVQVPLADLATKHGFGLVVEEVTRLDVEARAVHTRAGPVAYDFLVLAMGGAKLRPPGVEHTLSLCGAPEQALALRDRLDALLERGEGRIAVGFGGNPKDSSAVRGGPAFEFVFNVHKLLKDRGVRDRFELTFFAPMRRPGIRMGEGAYQAMESMFEAKGIEKRFGVKIERFERDGVRFVDGAALPADLVMFIPAGTGHPLVEDAGLPVNEAGFVRIDDYCEVDHDFYASPDRYPVFAVGDVAALEGPDWRAKQGHVAEVMGRVAATNIANMVAGRPEREGYAAHVDILCVMDTGDGAAFVRRDQHDSRMTPLPWVGHWLKKGWGWYWRQSKMGKIPRLPGM